MDSWETKQGIRDLGEEQQHLIFREGKMEKVSVVMSVYRPDPRYLAEQLVSLNDQDFGNLELVVWNDCPGEPVDRALFERCVTRFPVSFFGGEENLGYVKAFVLPSRSRTYSVLRRISVRPPPAFTFKKIFCGKRLS